jgi:uncharacterized protein YaaR (DUF327 family)
MLNVDTRNSSAANLPAAAIFGTAQSKLKKTGGSRKSAQIKKAFSTFIKDRLDKTESAENVADDLPIAEAFPVLMDDVREKGDVLANRPFPSEIRNYRQAVRNLLGRVIDAAYGVAEDSGLPNYLKAGFDKTTFKADPERRTERKKYQTVRVIDQKLDKLAAGIMMGQSGQMGILRSIEEINGLLVDLLR